MMQPWIYLEDALPAIGSNVEVMVSHSADHACYCAHSGFIAKVVGLPEPGEDWPMGNKFILAWRRVQ